MGPALKYCGITTLDDLLYALKLGVGFVGFNFYQGSKRFIGVEDAASLWRTAKEQLTSFSTTPVGVCVDMEDSAIEKMITDFPDLEIIQCHGSETPARLGKIRTLLDGRRIWKAIHVNAPEDLTLVQEFFDIADLLLYDTKASISGELGGTGQRFDWSLLNRIHASQPFALAGGVKKGMISAAGATGAAIVDLCSGIEKSPGVKSSELMQAIYDEANES